MSSLLEVVLMNPSSGSQSEYDPWTMTRELYELHKVGGMPDATFDTRSRSFFDLIHQLVSGGVSSDPLKSPAGARFIVRPG